MIYHVGWLVSRDLYVMPLDFISRTKASGRRPETEIAYTPLAFLSANKSLSQADQRLKTSENSYLFSAIWPPNCLRGSSMQPSCQLQSRIENNGPFINFVLLTHRSSSLYSRKCYLYCSSFAKIRHSFHSHHTRTVQKSVNKHV